VGNLPNNPRYEDVLLTMKGMPVITPDAKNDCDTLDCRVWEGGVTGAVYIGFFNPKDDKMVFRAMTTPEEGRRLIEGIKYAEEMEKLAK
jgi:hypothetical protein